MNDDPRVMQFFPKRLAREESDATVDRIEEHFRSRGFGLYAAELRCDGRFIGYVGLHTPTFSTHFTPCIEIGWRLATEVWGQGLATEGARAVVRLAFENLSIDEIVSFTVPANQRSIRVMQKLGMTHDPEDDFEHPSLLEGHSLRSHVLYRLKRSGAAR